MIRSYRAACAAALLLLPATACSAGADDAVASGSGAERRYAVDGFDTVGLVGSGDVSVRVGPAFSVTATGDPATLDKVRVWRDGHTLNLGRKRGVRFGGGERVRFAVTMPRIAGAAIGGSGSISVDRVSGDRFNGSIGGSGRLDARGMAVDKAEFAIGGSGDITAAGRARSTEVSIGGAGKVHNAALASDHASVSIAGAGNVEVRASKTADVTVVGSGAVRVTGGAKCDITRMGSARVDCG